MTAREICLTLVYMKNTINTIRSITTQVKHMTACLARYNREAELKAIMDIDQPRSLKKVDIIEVLRGFQDTYTK